MKRLWEYCELRVHIGCTGGSVSSLGAMELWTCTPEMNVERAKIAKSAQPQEILKQLSILGNEGWELIFVAPIGDRAKFGASSVQHHSFFFKRPKE